VPADWDLLTTAFLHDPPDKALDIRGHERRAARYLEAALGRPADVSLIKQDAGLADQLAAVAERFWSPADVGDVPDMLLRLDWMSRRLEWIGLTHQTNYRTMLERLAGGDPIGPLEMLASVLRPVSNGIRERSRQYTQQTPLNRVADTVLPVAPQPLITRDFLIALQSNDAQVKPALVKNALLQEMIPVSATVSKLAAIGIAAMDYIASGKPAPDSWAPEQRAFIAGIMTNPMPPGEVAIAIAEPIGKLVDKAVSK